MAALHCVISKCRGTESSEERRFWYSLEEKDPFQRIGLVRWIGSKENGKGSKTSRWKRVKARVELSPENLNSTSSEEKSDIPSVRIWWSDRAVGVAEIKCSIVEFFIHL